MYSCEQGCSGCCGPKSFVAFTTNRVIARQQGAKQCICCCEGPHVDIAVYLSDIEVLTESRGPAALCGGCCSCSCCGDVPKHIGVKGGFGTEILTFKKTEAVDGVNELAALIQPYKQRP